MNYYRNLLYFKSTLIAFAIINIARKNFRQWWRQTWKGFCDFRICWSGGERQTIENVANHKNKINISLRQITISSWFITFEPFFNNGKSFIPLAPLLSPLSFASAHKGEEKSESDTKVKTNFFTRLCQLFNKIMDVEMYKWMEIKASVPSSKERRICILSLWVAHDEKSFSFLLALLPLDYYIFSVLGAKKAREEKPRKERKSSQNPFAGKRQAKMLKFFCFLLSNQCVAWYMSDIIAFKNIIFSLNVEWMSVQARHEYRRAWDEGMAAEISFVGILR